MPLPIAYVAGFILSISVIAIISYRVLTGYGVSETWKWLGIIATVQVSLISVHISEVILTTTSGLIVLLAVCISVGAVASGVLCGHVSARFKTKHTNTRPC